MTKIAEGLASGEFVRNRHGVIVCSTCGGNCGQCGNTGSLGNVPVDMQSLIDNLNKPRLRPEPVVSFDTPTLPSIPWGTILTVVALFVAALLLTACAPYSGPLWPPFWRN